MIKKTLALIISMFMVCSMVNQSTTKAYADTVGIKMVIVGMLLFLSKRKQDMVQHLMVF